MSSYRVEIQAMICSNDNCSTWYRVGNHFFTTCPTCKVPMKKVNKEVKISRRNRSSRSPRFIGEKGVQ